MDSHTMAGHLIRRLHQQSTAVFAQKTQDAGFDLTPVQFAALDAIQANPQADQARIAELIGYDRATIGGVIERLEKKRWVKRVVSEQDRRARLITLTDKGLAMHLKAKKLVERLQSDILEPLSVSEQQMLLALVAKIVWRT